MEQITKRIEELVSEINDLLQEKESHIKRVSQIEDGIIAKQGAIFELKKLMEKDPEDAAN